MNIFLHLHTVLVHFKCPIWPFLFSYLQPDFSGVQREGHEVGDAGRGAGRQQLDSEAGLDQRRRLGPPSAAGRGGAGTEEERKGIIR